jgi:hypothetical protein
MLDVVSSTGLKKDSAMYLSLSENEY